MAVPAELIRVVRKGTRFSLTVNGTQFPWYVDLVETVVAGDRPTVRLTLPAGRVEVIDEPAPTPALNTEPEVGT